jgi:hypothetical protein
MHWFWRAAVAALAILTGWLFTALTGLWFQGWQNHVAESLARRMLRLSPDGAVDGKWLVVHFTWPFAVAVPSIVAALFVYWGCTWALVVRRGMDRETRCRKCDHILRGISEPRCPECGERI